MNASLEQESDNEFVLHVDTVWITVENVSIRVYRTGEYVKVDLYPLDNETAEAFGSTQVAFDDVRRFMEGPCNQT